jgi:rhodanese-related sulfurtransferase
VTQARSDEPFLRVGPAEAKGLIEKGIRVLDVREPQEYAEVRIPGSTLVPLGTLLKSPREVLGKGAALFVCSEGIRSAVASEAAAAIGLDEVYNLEGGTQRWQAEGFPVESGTPDEPIVTPVTERPSAGPTVGFLQSGEHLVRVHRFRYLRAVACALGTLDLVVEESLDDVNDSAKRCVARPDHPERVARPEFTVYEESVEAALRALIEKLRGRLPADIFLPTE